MARSSSHATVLAIFGAVVCAVFHRLPLNAFVSPSPSFGASGLRSQSRVLLAASKAEIAEAEKQAKLLVWAAKTAAEQGAPQAATMQAKADQAVRALEALKQQQDGKAPPAPAAAAATIQRTAMSMPVMVEEIAELEKQVRLLKWAAQTAAAKGMAQAPAAQARADQAVQRLVQLKEQQEMHQGGRSVATSAVPAMPVASAPAAAAPAAASGASKAEIAEAERHAKLLVWAAKTAAEQGAPQAATMQAKADQAVRALEALKQQQQGAKAPLATAPPVAVAPSPPPAQATVTHAALEEVKKEMNLLVWAAKTAAEKGMPQAAMMQSKADVKKQEYESLVQKMEAVRR